MSSFPRLSLIYGARNDQYMGNFRWRFETTLNYLADNLQGLGRLKEVEIVIADWGSEVPLHRVLSLGPSARHLVRFVVVPPDLARQVQGDSEFPIVIAQNVAVRYSRGEYVAQTDSDVMFPRSFLSRLFEILDGRRSIGMPLDAALVTSSRRHVPWSYASRSPGAARLAWTIHHLGRFLPKHPRGRFGFQGTGFYMMHRNLWEECRGYDERLVHWGWMEIDLGIRVTRKYPWFGLESLGLDLYHLDHYPPWMKEVPRKYNPMSDDNVFCPNDEAWGLSRHDRPLEVVSARDPGDGDSRDFGGRSSSLFPRLTAIAIIGRVVANNWYRARAKYLERQLTRPLSLWRKRVRRVWSELESQPLSHWPSVMKAILEHRGLRL